jgi:hypothetical protein
MTIPPYAGMIWHDGTNLLLQLPESGHITKLSLTEMGLHKALNLIQQRCYINGHSPPATLTKVKRPKQAYGFSESQRQSARDVLRRLKIA